MSSRARQAQLPQRPVQWLEWPVRRLERWSFLCESISMSKVSHSLAEPRFVVTLSSNFRFCSNPDRHPVPTQRTEVWSGPVQWEKLFSSDYFAENGSAGISTKIDSILFIGSLRSIKSRFQIHPLITTGLAKWESQCVFAWLIRWEQSE